MSELITLLLAQMTGFGVEAAYAIEAIQPASGNIRLTNGGIFNLGGAGDTVGKINAVGFSIIDFMSLLAGALAVIYILWHGLQYIISGGNPDKVKAARAGIINGIIGIAIITAAYAIVRFAVGIGQRASEVI